MCQNVCLRTFNVLIVYFFIEITVDFEKRSSRTFKNQTFETNLITTEKMEVEGTEAIDSLDEMPEAKRRKLSSDSDMDLDAMKVICHGKHIFIRFEKNGRINN